MKKEKAKLRSEAPVMQLQKCRWTFSNSWCAVISDSDWNMMSGKARRSRVATPGIVLAPETRSASGTMTTNRSEIGTCFATARAPRQTTQALVAGAGGGGRAILALVEVFLFLHRKETLFFLDAFAVDATAANSSIHA